MVRVPGVSLKDLDKHGKEFQDIVHKELLYTLKKVASTAQDVNDLGYIPTVWKTTVVAKILLPYIEGLVHYGVNHVHKQSGLTAGVLGVISKIPNHHLEQYLLHAKNRLVGIGDTVWDKARLEMVEGVKSGLGISAIKDLIIASVELSAGRASTVARTEVNSAANYGAIEGVRSLEVEATKEWISTEDGATRPDHADADGQQVPINDPFDIGGEYLDRPGDPEGSPENTVNCRCTIAFNIPDDQPQDNQAQSDPSADDESMAASANHASKANKPDALIEALQEGEAMPYRKEQGYEDCPDAKPWAVIDTADDSLEGCYETEGDADEQVAILVADDKSPPDLPPKATSKTMASEPTPINQSTEDSAPAGWEGPIVVEGVSTGDGREFAPDALKWADLPLPLRWNMEDSHGGVPHTVAVNVGRIDEIWKDGNEIWGRGVFNLNEENGRRAHALVKDKFLRGVSVDVDDVADADMELIWPETPESVEDPNDDEIIMEIMFGAPEKVIFHGGRIRAATLCDIPAFVEAYVRLIEPSEASIVASALGTSIVDVALVAHAAHEAWRPRREWFEDPQFSQLCPIVVTETGRVYGHAAQWGQCHLGYGDTQCVTVPRETSHDYFLTGQVICQDDSTIPVGQITAGIGHAPLYMGARPAAEHYDNTDAVVADITIGNDKHGIWVAGAIRPWAREKAVHELRASGQLSPDWRSIGGQLRMVGMLAVNISGFQVPNAHARVASGEVHSLVAAGIPRLGRRNPTIDPAFDSKVLVQQLASRIGLDEESKQEKRKRQAEMLAAHIHKGSEVNV